VFLALSHYLDVGASPEGRATELALGFSCSWVCFIRVKDALTPSPLSLTRARGSGSLTRVKHTRFYLSLIYHYPGMAG